MEGGESDQAKRLPFWNLDIGPTPNPVSMRSGMVTGNHLKPEFPRKTLQRGTQTQNLWVVMRSLYAYHYPTRGP